ncbi:MAG: hypothetical protein PHR96_04805 [Clostridia bacterium]|nr:hypothetical protein [Clostridia bacterium]
MKKYTEMNNDKRRELYKQFLFFLQSKHSSGTEPEIKLYEFALRYNLLPKYYDDHLTPKESRPMYKGYLLFLKEKFGIINDDDFKTPVSLLKDDYNLHYSEIECYGFPSFNEYMEKSTEFGPKETTRFLNDLYRSFCFDKLRWQAKRKTISMSNYRSYIINRFQDEILNKNETNIQKISDKLRYNIFTLPIYEKDKAVLREYLNNITNALTYHNALNQKDYYRSFCFDELRGQAEKRETLISSYKIKMIDQFQNEILYKNEINIEAISDNLSHNILKLPITDEDKIDLKEYLIYVTNSLTYHNALRQMNLNIIEFFMECQKLKSDIKPTKNQKDLVGIEK